MIRSAVDILTMIIALAVVATLVRNSTGTSRVVSSSATGFAKILRTAQGR